MPAASASPEAVNFNITGGTDVAWSPPIDYLSHVLLPVLAAMGLDCTIQVQRRGYYPRGGRVSATINPSRLNGLDIIKEQGSVRGVSHCSHLPAHVAQRQADSTMDTLKRAGYSYSIEVVTVIIHLQAAV